MKARYISIWRLRGASELSDAADGYEVAQSGSYAVAKIVANPEAFFTHVDRAQALAAVVLKGIFTPGALEPENPLMAELDKIRSTRCAKTPRTAYLVIEGEDEAATPNLSKRADTDSFIVCFDAIDKGQEREKYRSFTDAVIAALTLGLPPDVDHKVEHLGEVIFLQDASEPRPIYTLSITGGPARLSLARRIEKQDLDGVARLVSALVKDKSIARAQELLSTSLSESTTDLEAFLAAWSALEIFVNKSFKAVYEKQWFATVETTASAASKPIFARLKDVMRDKYRLLDKFLMVAATLNPIGATRDVETFRGLKTLRDKLMHDAEVPRHLPTHEIQTLLKEYMRLHLNGAD